MTLEQLIYFTETARHEHIGKAAKVLHISTSAISHSIKALEAELRYDLFQKKGKNIVLTENGRALLERSQDLIRQFQELKHNLLGSHTEKMNFRIAASHMMSHEFMAPTWAKLTCTYPQVSLELFTLRSADVIKGVLERELDFGMCFSPQAHPEIQSHDLYHGELLLCVRKGHPFLKGKRKLSTLSEFKAVLPKAFQGVDPCMTHPMFGKFGLSPSATTLTDSYNICLEVVRHSDHWSFVPDILLRGKKDVIPLVKVKGWDAPFKVSLIHLKKRFIPEFLLDLKSGLQEALELQ